MKKFDQYRRHLAVLTQAESQDLTNEFILGGIIDKFYIQFELGWKVLKELLTYEGVASAASGSPREIIKHAYKYYPCMQEEVWLAMLSQRNNTAHIYDEQAAKRLVDEIIETFVPAFLELEKSILEKYGELLESL